MSKLTELYKGRPSKLVQVIDAGEAFEYALCCKPPSALSRSVWMEKLMSISEDKGVHAASPVEQMAEMAIDLILITACDDLGKPVFFKDDREFLQETLELHHHDMMVEAACEIIGNIPVEVVQGMRMDILKGDDEEDDDENKDEDDESKVGKLDE